MERSGARLLLDLRPARCACEAVDLPGIRGGRRLELEAVLADVAQLGNTHDLPRNIAGPAGDARDECVAACEPAELRAGRIRRRRVLRPGHDRCEHAVDVEQQRGPVGLCREAGERIHAA